MPIEKLERLSRPAASRRSRSRPVRCPSECRHEQRAPRARSGRTRLREAGARPTIPPCAAASLQAPAACDGCEPSQLRSTTTACGLVEIDLEPRGEGAHTRRVAVAPRHRLEELRDEVLLEETLDEIELTDRDRRVRRDRRQDRAAPGGGDWITTASHPSCSSPTVSGSKNAVPAGAVPHSARASRSRRSTWIDHSLDDRRELRGVGRRAGVRRVGSGELEPALAIAEEELADDADSSSRVPRPTTASTSSTSLAAEIRRESRDSSVSRSTRAVLCS